MVAIAKETTVAMVLAVETVTAWVADLTAGVTAGMTAGVTAGAIVDLLTEVK